MTLYQSGNTGAQYKGDGVEKKEPKKEEANDVEVDNGKGVVDSTIDTPIVT